MVYSFLVTITLMLLNAECLQGLQGVDIVGVDNFTQLCISLLSPSLTCLLVLV